MPITKLNRRRSIVVLLCAMLLFGTVFSTTVFADTALISSAPMTSYFETYTSTGAWTDLQTPAHWITATGEVAYCLQTAKDNPYNAGYYTIDGEEVYDYGVLTGLKAILDHGYPATTMGFSDEEARYATANGFEGNPAMKHCSVILCICCIWPGRRTPTRSRAVRWCSRLMRSRSQKMPAASISPAR